MTALPLVPVPSIPSAIANGGENNKLLLALLESLRPEKRHVFLQPNDALSTGSLNVVKETLEGFAAEVGEEQEVSLKESRKRKRGGGGRGEDIDVLKLRKVYVDGFETEQVWQQARRIIGSVLRFSGGLLDELEEEGEVVAGGQQGDGDNNEDEVEGDEEDGGEEEEERDADLSEGHWEDLEDGDEDEDEGDEDEDEDIDQLENGIQGGLNEDDGEEEDDDEEDAEEYAEDPDGLNDGFFNLDEFNRQSRYFEEQDARGDPNTDRASDDEEIDWDADPLTEAQGGSKKSSRRKLEDDDEDPLQDDDGGEEDDDEEEDGPTFGDMALDAPEGDSEDEAMNDEAMDDEGMDLNANGIYYKEFFAPPPRKSKGGKPKKSVRFQPEPPAEEDVDRAMADVRRDLFDDESENDSEDALSDVSAGDPKSRRSAHERRQAKLAEEMRKLEAASVAKREWTLSGEAAAADRPLNSLLEEDLDFEHVGKPIPVITPEVTEGIEDMIKRRILAQQFDEVLRRRPDADAVPNGTRRGMIELDDSKPSKSLAEVYEEEHVKNANPDTYVSQSDEKLQREEKEVAALWKDVSARLDALSSWHYRPKPSAPTVSVVADVAAVAMEDAQPTTASAITGESSRMAPQEVYKAGGDNAARGEVVTSGGLPLARQEMSRQDKLRRRRRAKERMRKAGSADAASAASATANGTTKKTLSTRAKMQRDTIAELKKGGVKVINRKGEITDVEGKKAKVTAKIASGGSYKL
ncbi:u3 snornp [Trichoderma cornu-damae]|uniref:U3 small nucleolar ribonucleoprotein protein MPP10 n=1 Tax=Trichoderma cornu-damae TaxID=654480 RepID=A0A9P8TTZ6_9HYPO|nr:u3 snornp [Trichoderma cornu-damae]